MVFLLVVSASLHGSWRLLQSGALAELCLASLFLPWVNILACMLLLLCSLLTVLWRQPRWPVPLTTWSRTPRVLLFESAAVLFVGHRSALEIWPQPKSGPRGGTLWAVALQDADLCYVLPPLIFAGVLLYGMSIFARAPRDAMWRTRGRQFYAHLATGTWALTACFYMLQQFGGTPQVQSVYGNRIIPLRYLLEPVAATPLVLTIYCCTSSVIVANTAPRKEARARLSRLRRELARTQLFQFLMMGSAFAGSYPRFSDVWDLRLPRLPGVAINLACVLVTWIFFYANVITLRHWLLHAAAAPRLHSSAKRTFRFFAAYVVVIWHLHPVAWTLGASGLVDEQGEQVIWVLADFFSKSVPLVVLAHFAAEPIGDA